jgi:hypothetical protein
VIETRGLAVVGSPPCASAAPLAVAIAHLRTAHIGIVSDRPGPFNGARCGALDAANERRTR